MAGRADYILGTAGHIDHGKTALVRALTGIDTDRLPDEKQRGITIDLGFAQLDLNGIRLGLVDVPGHERFIRNMVAGATGFDLALLVVAADDSVMPQTREHLEILEFLGLNAGVVAITKCDLVDPDWLDLVEEDLHTLFEKSTLRDAPIVRTSATTGDGIEALRGTLEAVVRGLPDRPLDRPFRLPIDRAFSVPGHGTVVTGTVVSGAASVGEELEWLPSGRLVRIRGIQRHEKPAERASRGGRAAINLAGVRLEEVHRGQELAAPGFLKPSTLLTVRLRAAADALRPIRHRGRYRLHLGTADVSCLVSLLDGPELSSGGEMMAQLVMTEPVVAVQGQPFVIREESPAWTAGGGVVLQPAPKRIRRRDRAARARLPDFTDADPIVRAEAALANYGLEPWTRLDLGRDAGLDPAEADRVTTELAERQRLVELKLGPRKTARLPEAYVGQLEGRILKAVDRLHQKNPRLSSIRRAHVAGALSDLKNDALVSSLIDRLQAQGRLLATDRTVALPDFQPRLTQAERRLKNELDDAHRAGGFAPPLVPELVERAGQRSSTVPELLELLAEEGRLVEIAPENLFLSAEADAELRRIVTERLSEQETMTMADLRDWLGTTRKYAVPIGEYLDRIGQTVREGDTRRLNPEARIPREPSDEVGRP